MPGVARKIEIARQLEEARQSLSEAKIDFPADRRMRASVSEERIARRAGIVATLEFCQLHELQIREFIRGKQGQ